jgi:hypothetical protein
MKRTMVFTLCCAASVLAWWLGAESQNGRPLDAQRAVAIRVGETFRENGKCCMPGLRSRCENDAVLSCQANPVCSDAVEISDKCADATCNSSYGGHICEYGYPAGAYLKKCYETGEVVQCDGGFRCDYVQYTYLVCYKRCLTSGDICIWAGDICPML